MKRLLIIISMFILTLGSMGWAAEKGNSATGIKAIFEKGEKLYDDGKFEEALQLLNDALKKFPDNRKDLLEGKYYTLMELKRYKEMLQVALERDKITGEKSANRAFEVAKTYLYLKNTSKAIKWVEKSVERGLLGYHRFKRDDFYKPLRGERLNGLIKQIKANLGIGKPVKSFNLKDLAGNPISPTKYKGKVLLIDFWATWCPPCRKEMPNLKKDYADFKAKGFEIVGISLDSNRKKLDDYIKENNLKWTMSYSGKGWDDPTSDDFGVNSIPSTWLVDRKGNLRYFGLRGEELRAAVEKLLTE